MKKLVLISILFFSVKTAFSQKVIRPDFPKEMLESVKAQYLLKYEKGQVLYNINCARCHTTKVGKKTIVPDFTESQLIGYEFRVLNPKHESEIQETTVTEEELGLIIIFLKYKKRNE